MVIIFFYFSLFLPILMLYLITFIIGNKEIYLIFLFRFQFFDGKIYLH
jgi:hypothetical protein